MSADWHYTKDGQKYGPVSAAELKALAQDGKLAPTDMVWKTGMAEWKVASSVKGLFLAPTSDSPPPAPPASNEPVSSAPVGDSFSFVDKVKGRLGKAAAKSFIRKNRLWIGIGAGVVACIILVLFLLPAGTLPGGKKGYTQRILDLDPKSLTTLDEKTAARLIPKTKAEHPPGTVADMLEALAMFKGGKLLKGGRNLPRTQDCTYRASVGVQISRVVFEKVFGPVPVEDSGEKLADTWKIACTDQTVVIAAYVSRNPNMITVNFVYWDIYDKTYCTEK